MRKPPSRTALTVLLTLVWGVIGVMAAPGALASAVCPPPPDTLAGLISTDSVEAGPLTEQFRPVYGVFAETASGCWAGSDIRVSGFVASPEGLGGVMPFSIEPTWMTSRAHFLSTTDTVDPESGPIGPFFPVAVPPSLERAFSGLGGNWVRVTGHFDDRAATTCLVAASDPALGAVPTAEQAIQICRTSFVLTDVQALGALPTDTVPSVVPGAPPGWIAPLATVIAAVAFGVMLRRSRHPSRNDEPTADETAWIRDR